LLRAKTSIRKDTTERNQKNISFQELILMDDFEPIEVPEISPLELAERMKQEPGLWLLDVREKFEVQRARLEDPRVIIAPLSELAQQQLGALPAQIQDREVELVVFCHLGQRSAQVAWWLRELGWRNVVNLAGGIDAYARLVDPRIERY
jgi:rhodanese-related sulfurtransferase